MTVYTTAQQSEDRQRIFAARTAEDAAAGTVTIRAIVVIAALALFFASCTGENPRDAHFQIYGCSPSNLQPDGRCGLSLK